MRYLAISGFQPPLPALFIPVDIKTSTLDYHHPYSSRESFRLILTSEHTKAQLDRALETLERVAKRLHLL